MKTCLFHAGLLLLLLSTAVKAEQTAIQYLSGTDKDHTVDWEFHVNGGRHSNVWTTIPVPSNWEMQGFGTYHYWCDWCENPAPDSEGLYRLRFTVPASWGGKDVSIMFGGVMTDAQVRVNGTLAGPVHRGGFYQFSYPISDLLQYDRENLLEVKVNRYSSDASVNLAERRADFWLFSGIYRPVWLEAKPAQHIERVDLDARHGGEFMAKVAVHSVAGEAAANRLTATVRQLDGKVIGKPVSTTLTPDSKVVSIKSFFRNIEPWSAENPQRYRVTFQLKHNRQLLHEVSETFGFRTVELRPRDGLYVNGEKVRLKGANRHSFWPDSGRTTSADISARDVALIKQMNMNAVRASHYPPDSHFLEAADKYGLYVINELTGWQDAYTTTAGEPLVRELIQRDANHPSVILWANGNEGGWNTELDDDFHHWDMQQRPVIHPWGNFGGIDTGHYNVYDCCAGSMYHGRDLVMPTEFLHGLYDGGAGAGLDDWWNQIMRYPLATGGFIWALADEGIVRDDKQGAIDVAGNSAPDGIVGPYREKEGSFYAIKEIWSPVYLPQAEVDFLPPTFDGRLTVENRYDFTNLERIDFSWRLANFPGPHSQQTGYRTAVEGRVKGPNVPAGHTGQLLLKLPDNWQRNDVLYLTATDDHQREIYTWSWMIHSAGEIAGREQKMIDGNVPVNVERVDDVIEMTRGDLKVAIDAITGYLRSVTRAQQKSSLVNGPRLVQGEAKLKTPIRLQQSGDTQVVRAEYDGALKYVQWQLHTNGWLQLDYAYQLPGGKELDYMGVTFDYPEEVGKNITWLGKGPYRVWKNRTKGVEFNVWRKNYNDTVTGLSWNYPEFKGFHNNVYWATMETSELPMTLLFTDENMALRLFTPTEADSLGFDPMDTHVAFPPGDISFLQAIAPIGTKFHPPADHGPDGAKNITPRLGLWYASTVYFYFGDLDG